MGKVIVIEHLKLDGVMQAPGHPEEDPRDGFQHGGWANRSQDPAMQEAMGARMSSGWSLLAGRTTYERFAEYWPKQEPKPVHRGAKQRGSRPWPKLYSRRRARRGHVGVAVEPHH